MKEGRDIIQWSRHQMLRKEVATFLSGRDISCKEWRSRHHLAVATSAASKEGRDIIQRSRHHLQKKQGRDVSQWSRHQLQVKKVATSISCRDIICKERRSRHNLAVATSDPRDDEDKSRPNKSSYDITKTTEVATLTTN